MLDQKVWDGVHALLDCYARIQRDDFVLIAYTPECSECAAWISVALDERGVSAYLLAMEPLQDPTVGVRLTSCLPRPDALRGRLVIFTLELHTMSHTDVFRHAAESYDPARCVIIRAMSVCAELFSQALTVSPQDLDALNATVLHRVMRAKCLKMTAPGGTDLTATLDSARYRWISNRGIWRPGGFVIIPSGEVATFPDSISGILVADYALHVNQDISLDARLERCPIEVLIEHGMLSQFRCDDARTEAFLNDVLSMEGARYVGELGFGTNIGVTHGTAMNSHINERKPGIHIGFGQHNQRGIISRSCDVHLDLIARGGLVWTDSESTALDLEHVAPAYDRHPIHVQDEDVFSPESSVMSDDCCGMGCDVRANARS